MPTTDFRNDVDGFAFRNDWTFNQAERQQINDIIHEILPAAAAILTPVLAAASPIVVATAAPWLGLAAPILPLLPILAPVFADKIIEAVADKVAGGENDGNLCGGMAPACLDYYRLKWVVPRGNNPADTPKAIADGGDQFSDNLRSHIWNGQLDSHRNDTPKFIAWTAIGLFLGDMGKSWLCDRTREELQKIDAQLAAGDAVVIALVLRADSAFKGHVVVATGLTWNGPNRCRLEIYDNERPDQLTVFDVDVSGDEAQIERTDHERHFSALFCGTYQPIVPPPAVFLANGFATDAAASVSQGEPIKATFDVKNGGFGDVRDLRGGVGSGSAILAVEPVPVDDKGVAKFDPITIWTTAPKSIDMRIHDAGLYGLVPLAVLSSNLVPGVVFRRLPTADGGTFIPPPLKVTPRIPLTVGPRKGGGAASGECRRPATEGETVVVMADLTVIPAITGGVQSISWTVTGATNFAPSGGKVTITLPGAGQTVHIEIAVALNDNTVATGKLDLTPLTSAAADRVVQLCQLLHIVSYAPLRTIPFGPATDPLRLPELTKLLERAMDPKRILSVIEAGLKDLRTHGKIIDAPDGNFE